MFKKLFISFCILIAVLVVGALGFLVSESGLLDDLFSKDEVTLTTNGKKEVFKKLNGKYVRIASTAKNFPSNHNNNIANNQKFGLNPIKVGKLQKGVKVTPNKARLVEFQNVNNGNFTMKIPKGWVVGNSKTDYVHYTFMIYDPKNPDFRIYFNMKTEGYLKTQQMRNFYRKYYPKAPMAKLPAVNPQTTDAFYRVFTEAHMIDQNLLGFKVPVIRNYQVKQTLGKNMTGGSIQRATFQNEFGKNVEGVFTVTIKEFQMPPVVMLIMYNTVFFTAPEGELVDWIPVLNYSLSTIRFTNEFINGYYRQEGQIAKNANALQAICNQTSNIITSGWNARQKTYDILSQKRSDATMGYERVRDTETGEIYKAYNGFSDHDWNGRYETITDDMYLLPTAGYIEKN